MEEIKDVKDVINIIDNIDSYFDRPFFGYKLDNFWFRGQQSSEWNLKPSAYRKEVKNTEEFLFFNEFRREYPNYKKKCRDRLDWISFMQHYSLPTRLLDWTENILIALYFATSEFQNKEKNKFDSGSLSVLNVTALNSKAVLNAMGDIATAFGPDVPDIYIRTLLTTDSEIRGIMSVEEFEKDLFLERLKDKLKEKGFKNSALKDNDFKEKIRYPVGFYPRIIADRMKFQSSVFTIHGGKIYPTSNYPSPIGIEEAGENIVKQFEIPHKYKSKIRNQLYNLGIHEGSLFPELENQANHLKAKVIRKYSLQKH